MIIHPITNERIAIVCGPCVLVEVIVMNTTFFDILINTCVTGYLYSCAILILYIPTYTELKLLPMTLCYQQKFSNQWYQ